MFAWCLTSSPPRSSRDFDVLRPPLLERAARIVAGLQICAVDDRRRVVPMGASRARHVNGSRRRQGSTCFRSNDGSCSVRAVFGLPPRSDRGSRRAAAVPIPDGSQFPSRPDCDRAVQIQGVPQDTPTTRGGREARRSGRVANREGGGDQAQIPGWSIILGALLIVEVLPSARAAGQTFFTDCLPSHRAPDDPIVYPKQPGASHLHDVFGNTTTNAFSTYAGMLAAARTVRSREIRQRIGRRRCRASMEIRSRVPPRTALKSAERPADEPSGQA